MDLLDVLRGTLSAGNSRQEERRNAHAGESRNTRPHRDQHEPRHAHAIERRPDFDVVTASPRFDYEPRHARATGRRLDFNVITGGTGRRQNIDGVTVGPSSESGQVIFDPPLDFSDSSSESEYSPRRRHHGYGDYLRDDEPFPEFEDVPRSRHRPNVEVTLLPVQSATLPEDEQTCSICMNKYDTPSTATGTEPSETEPAVRLICYHVIGKNCIQHWLEDGNTVCPLCRTDVYTGAAPPET
ncbi:hypothetical protein MMC22_001281 [Lobaria immixta]|nr:hypothetical protein [Lobaria immixta]